MMERASTPRFLKKGSIPDIGGYRESSNAPRWSTQKWISGLRQVLEAKFRSALPLQVHMPLRSEPRKCGWDGKKYDDIDFWTDSHSHSGMIISFCAKESQMNLILNAI
jgi:hypothetical protein